MTAVLSILAAICFLLLTAWVARRYVSVTSIVLCNHDGCTCSECGSDLVCPQTNE